MTGALVAFLVLGIGMSWYGRGEAERALSRECRWGEPGFDFDQETDRAHYTGAVMAFGVGLGAVITSVVLLVVQWAT